MPTQQEITLRQETQKSFDRMQQFKPETLSRETDLGNELNFKDVLPAAARLIALYQQISPTVLDDLPPQQLTAMQNQANADFNRFDQILKFSAKQNNPHGTRNAFIQQVESAYQEAFNQLHPIISYSTSKSADFKRLEREARATLQAIEDKTKELWGKFLRMFAKQLLNMEFRSRRSILKRQRNTMRRRPMCGRVRSLNLHGFWVSMPYLPSSCIKFL